jgi:hypothetical protein
MNNAAIKGFIKGTLGCTCPDKVFKEIRHETNAILPQCRSPVSRIELGDRLLLYLLITDSPDIVERDLPVIIRNGRQERDRRGFNRFRAVVCVSNAGDIAHLAEDVFARYSEKDEKVHLHVLTREDVKAIFEPTSRD